jgi:hypothetical protein
MALLGAVSGIWTHTSFAGIKMHPLQRSESSQVLPGVSTASNPHDAAGWHYHKLHGGSWIDAFRSVTAGAITWYYFCMRRSKPSDTAADIWHLFFSQYDADLRPAQGRLGLFLKDGGTGNQLTYELQLKETTAGLLWGDVAGATTGQVLSCGTGDGAMANQPVYYVTMEVDTSTTPNTVSVYLGDKDGMMTPSGGSAGDPYFTTGSGGVSALSAAAVITGTPSILCTIFGAGGKGTVYNDVDVYEVLVNDDQDGQDDTKFDYHGEDTVVGTSPHIFTMTAVSDVAGGSWSPTNTNRPGELWPCIDDPFDDDDKADEIYVINTDPPTEKDQWFEANDDYHVAAQTPTIYGIHVVTHTTSGTTTLTDRLLLKDAGDGTPTADEDAGVSEGSLNNYWRYGRCHWQSPDSNRWVHDHAKGAGSLEAVQFGVQSNTYHGGFQVDSDVVFISVCGTYLKQPANAAAPAVTVPNRVYQVDQAVNRAGTY